MRTVSLLDLRRRLAEILDAASAGERYLIERDGKPLAMLVSVEDGLRLDPEPEARRRSALDALDRLARHGQAMAARHPSDMQAAEAIRMERDRDDSGIPG